MILNEERLEALDNERINNNIDRLDIVKIVSTYALQDKVSAREFDILNSFCSKLLNFDDSPTEVTQLVFQKLPDNEDDVVKDFNLSRLVMKNDRTTIYENDEVRFSFDEKVIRVIIFDSRNIELKREIQKYFYGV